MWGEEGDSDARSQGHHKAVSTSVAESVEGESCEFCGKGGCGEAECVEDGEAGDCE